MKGARKLLDLDPKNMTVPELKEEAKRRGYKSVTKLRKPELIHLLETGELLDVATRTVQKLVVRKQIAVSNTP